MDPIQLILGVLLLVAIVSVVFLLWRLSSHSATSAAAQASLHIAENARDTAEAALAAARAQLQQAASDINTLTGKAAALEEAVRKFREDESKERQHAAHALQAANANAESLLAAERSAAADKVRMLAEQHQQALAAVEREYQAKLAGAQQTMAAAQKAAEEHNTQLKSELQQAREQLQSAFGHAAAEALRAAQQDFLNLAGPVLEQRAQATEQQLTERRNEVEKLVAPMNETLGRVLRTLGEIETSRTGSYADLNAKIQQLASAGDGLRHQTGQLVRALREPHVRGRYGELQLKRIVELAGMVEYCDFATQDSVRTAEGQAQRPDLVVKLPSGRELVVDAKANIQAYLEAAEATDDDTREAALERFARHVAEQATALSRKDYWKHYAGSPDFVVMYLPGDQFLDAALQRRPDLLDLAARQKVILATPATLIALLRAVAVGFREQSIADNAKALKDIAGELAKRLGKVIELVGDLGGSIESSVKKYNELVGSVQLRLLPSLKKMESQGIDKTLDPASEPATIVLTPRDVPVAALPPAPKA
ncbi:MAG: DNA recombination protein RmuC [Planctomycetaceae bacterium]|jgi:DNA recombination protein RmuC|nr:DNA recombination protein RmuC [Planctomycetaceae bacterium]